MNLPFASNLDKAIPVSLISQARGLVFLTVLKAGYGIGANFGTGLGAGDLHFSGQGMASAYTYSHSRGLYAGISLNSSVIVSRTSVNHRFYG
eukprot:gene28783-32180_t